MADSTQIPPVPINLDPANKWLPDTRTAIILWMMTSSFALIVLCWWRPPPADNQIVSMLVSVYVSTGFVTALQWWMGSSKGSDDKNATIKGMTQ